MKNKTGLHLRRNPLLYPTELIVAAVAAHYGLTERKVCSRRLSGRKAQEANKVLGRLLYRHGDGVERDWNAIGRITRVERPADCMFGAQPSSYDAILEQIDRRANAPPDQPPPDPEPSKIDAPSPVRIPEGVSGRRPRRGRRRKRPPTTPPPPTQIWEHALEVSAEGMSMSERVRLATERFELALQEGATLSVYKLRKGKQRAIFVDTAKFLRAIADGNPWFEKHWHAGRIGAPPRTGKTVIAGQIIAAAEMATTYVVSTQTLVKQAESDLLTQLPGVPIGVYYSHEKRLVSHGVNITTYAMISRYFTRHGHLPPELANSSLIFCDEGHRSMTKKRQRALRHGFDKDAVRIAMTGSEDFNERRQLRTYFPWLIHKITIEEALELDMFAPTRVYVAEVDVSASTVDMIAGDFDHKKLGKIMTAVPFFEATRIFRYELEENRELQALICCSGKRQARRLQEYLKERLPPGASEPVVVLAETPGRNKILEDYADGKIDTLINVGVLIEGWNAPKCKLLIDLAPSCSLVRATQKYFRPMTVWDDHEAAIYVLLPKELAAIPVLPMDLFGFERRQYEQGELISSNERQVRDKATPRKSSTMPRINKVRLASRFLFQGLFAVPNLDPENDEEIRQVLLSSPEVTEDQVPGFHAFMRTSFRHPLFTGIGQSLLAFLGLSLSLKKGKWQYLEFIARYLPDAAYRLWTDSNYCGKAGVRVIGDSCEPDREYLLQHQYQAPEKGTHSQAFADCWQHVASRAEALEGEGAEHDFDERFLWEALDKALETLTPRERRVLELRFGLFSDLGELTLKEVGTHFGLTRERIRAIEAQALRRLRHASVCRAIREFYTDGRSSTDRARPTH